MRAEADEIYRLLLRVVQDFRVGMTFTYSVFDLAPEVSLCGMALCYRRAA